MSARRQSKPATKRRQRRRLFTDQRPLYIRNRGLKIENCKLKISNWPDILRMSYNFQVSILNYQSSILILWFLAFRIIILQSRPRASRHSTTESEGGLAR